MVVLDQLLEIKNAGSKVARRLLLKKYDSCLMRDIIFANFCPLIKLQPCDTDYTESKGAILTPDDIYGVLRPLLDGETTSIGAVLNKAPERYQKLLVEIFTQTLAIGLKHKDIDISLPGCLPDLGFQNANTLRTGKTFPPYWVCALPQGRRVLLYVNDHARGAISSTGQRVDAHEMPSIRALPTGIYDAYLYKHQLVITEFIPMLEWGRSITPFKETLSHLKTFTLPDFITLATYTKAMRSNEIQKIFDLSYRGILVRVNTPYVSGVNAGLHKVVKFY